MIKDLSNDKVVFGLWLYILSDCALFAALFATYAVQHTQTFGGPGPGDLFNLSGALTETLLLLTSSFTCGLAVLLLSSSQKKESIKYKKTGFFFLILTFLLGLAFLGFEFAEFRQLILDGHGWQASSFLSAFFTLMGTHGLHV